MNSWILFLKSHKYGTFGPPFCMGISYQWSLVAACLRPTGVDTPAAPSPFPHHFTFSYRLLVPDGSEFGELICTTASNLTTACSLFFSLQLHPFIPRQCQLLNQHSSPKELITSSFLIFSPLFQLNHSPFLPLSPSHPTDFLSLKLETAFITVKHEKQDFPQMNWDDLSFGKITPKQTF